MPSCKFKKKEDIKMEQAVGNIIKKHREKDQNKTESKVAQKKQTGIYEPYILGEGEYPKRVFIGIKQT